MSISILWLTGELIRWIFIDENLELRHCQEGDCGGRTLSGGRYQPV